jgi:hypothetical protein
MHGNDKDTPLPFVRRVESGRGEKKRFDFPVLPSPHFADMDNAPGNVVIGTRLTRDKVKPVPAHGVKHADVGEWLIVHALAGVYRVGMGYWVIVLLLGRAFTHAAVLGGLGAMPIVQCLLSILIIAVYVVALLHFAPYNSTILMRMDLFAQSASVLVYISYLVVAVGPDDGRSPVFAVIEYWQWVVLFVLCMFPVFSFLKSLRMLKKIYGYHEAHPKYDLHKEVVFRQISHAEMHSGCCGLVAGKDWIYHNVVCELLDSESDEETWTSHFYLRNFIYTGYLPNADDEARTTYDPSILCPQLVSAVTAAAPAGASVGQKEEQEGPIVDVQVVDADAEAPQGYATVQTQRKDAFLFGSSEGGDRQKKLCYLRGSFYGQQELAPIADVRVVTANDRLSLEMSVPMGYTCVCENLGGKSESKYGGLCVKRVHSLYEPVVLSLAGYTDYEEMELEMSLTRTRGDDTEVGFTDNLNIANAGPPRRVMLQTGLWGDTVRHTGVVVDVAVRVGFGCSAPQGHTAVFKSGGAARCVALSGATDFVVSVKRAKAGSGGALTCLRWIDEKEATQGTLPAGFECVGVPINGWQLIASRDNTHGNSITNVSLALRGEHKVRDEWKGERVSVDGRPSVGQRTVVLPEPMFGLQQGKGSYVVLHYVTGLDLSVHTLDFARRQRNGHQRVPSESITPCLTVFARQGSDIEPAVTHKSPPIIAPVQSPIKRMKKRNKNKHGVTHASQCPVFESDSVDARGVLDYKKCAPAPVLVQVDEADLLVSVSPLSSVQPDVTGRKRHSRAFVHLEDTTEDTGDLTGQPPATAVTDCKQRRKITVHDTPRHMQGATRAYVTLLPESDSAVLTHTTPRRRRKRVGVTVTSGDDSAHVFTPKVKHPIRTDLSVALSPFKKRELSMHTSPIRMGSP